MASSTTTVAVTTVTAGDPESGSTPGVAQPTTPTTPTTPTAPVDPTPATPTQAATPTSASSVHKLRVLIAVDDGQQSQKAVDWYGKYIHKPGNEIILAHCSSVKMPDYNASPNLMKEITFKAQAQDSEIGRVANEILSKYGASGKFVTLLGKPAESLVEAVAERHINMVIMGKRHISKLKKKISGSVSSHVISHAHVPVLVCPEVKTSKGDKHEKEK